MVSGDAMGMSTSELVMEDSTGGREDAVDSQSAGAGDAGKKGRLIWK